MSIFSSIAESVNAINVQDSLAPLADPAQAADLQSLFQNLHIDAASDMLQGLPIAEGLSDTTIHADSVTDSIDAMQSSSQLQEVLQQLNTVLQDRHDTEVQILENLHASTDADANVDGAAIVAHADNDVATHDDAVASVHADATPDASADAA